MEGWGTGVLCSNLPSIIEFRATSGDIKSLKLPPRSAYRPSVFSGQKEKKKKSKKPFRKRTVGIPCKWPSVCSCECQEDMDKKPLASAAECNRIQILPLSLHSTFKRNSLGIYCTLYPRSGSVNSSLKANLACCLFYKWRFIGTQSCPFIHTFALQWRS